MELARLEAVVLLHGTCNAGLALHRRPRSRVGKSMLMAQSDSSFFKISDDARPSTRRDS